MSKQLTSVSHRETANNELIHRKGCPMKPGRTEISTRIAPVSKQPITVARCADCGNQIVLNEYGDEFTRESTRDEELGNVKASKSQARRVAPNAKSFEGED